MRYNQGLSCVGDIEIVSEGEAAYHVYHLYVIKTSKRDELKAILLRWESRLLLVTRQHFRSLTRIKIRVSQD